MWRLPPSLDWSVQMAYRALPKSLSYCVVAALTTFGGICLDCSNYRTVRPIYEEQPKHGKTKSEPGRHPIFLPCLYVDNVY